MLPVLYGTGWPEAQFKDMDTRPRPGAPRYNWSEGVPSPMWDRFIGVKELDLRVNGHHTLSPSVQTFQLLEELMLDENHLASLPTEIGDLQNLKYLSAGDNQLMALPTQIGSLSKLEILYLSGNPLVTLPTELGLLSALRFLNLQSNVASPTIPTQLANLPNLTILVGRECMGTDETVSCEVYDAHTGTTSTSDAVDSSAFLKSSYLKIAPYY